MRVGVVGAGSLGSVYGGFLSLGGHEVFLIDIYKEHVDAINAAGLFVETPAGPRVARPMALTQPEGVGEVDLVLILVKAYNTVAAAHSARPLLGNSTMVLTLQNGIGNGEAIGEVVGAEKVLEGASYLGAALLTPGRVLYTGKEQTFVGELRGGLSERATRLANTFTEAGLPTTAVSNIRGEMWRKLLGHLSISAFSALTRKTPGQLFRMAGTRQVVLSLLEEAYAVALATGIELPPAGLPERILATMEALPDSKPSMLQDIERGSRTEVGATNGAIVREGRLAGVPTPYNTLLAYLMAALEGSAGEG